MAGLRLDFRESALKGGDSDKKRLFQEMPPTGDRLTPEQMAQLDVDIKSILDEADRLTAQLGSLTDDQVEALDGEEWASIIAHGPPR